jgi:hypothetical protein
MMTPRCEQCGGALIRTPRTVLEKLFYSRAFICKACHHRAGCERRFAYYLSFSCKCPQCHTIDLERRLKADKIDRVARNPASLLQAMLGGRLYHCHHCRFQFYDLRRLPRAGLKKKAANLPG